MPVVRCGDMHGVDVRSREQFAKIVVGPAVLVLVMVVDARLGLLPIGLADIAHGNVLHVFATEECSLVATPLVADPDAPHHDPVAGRGTVGAAERRRSDDQGHSKCRGPCRLQELTAVGAGAAVGRHRNGRFGSLFCGRLSHGHLDVLLQRVTPNNQTRSNRKSAIRGRESPSVRPRSKRTAVPRFRTEGLRGSVVLLTELDYPCKGGQRATTDRRLPSTRADGVSPTPPKTTPCGGGTGRGEGQESAAQRTDRLRRHGLRVAKPKPAGSAAPHPQRPL